MRQEDKKYYWNNHNISFLLWDQAGFILLLRFGPLQKVRKNLQIWQIDCNNIIAKFRSLVIFSKIYRNSLTKPLPSWTQMAMHKVNNK